MPAMTYTVRWPDASETTAYSPSRVIREYFEPGRSYSLSEFLGLAREATGVANQRVQAKFGFACSRASEQLDMLYAQARLHADQPDARVEIVRFGPAD